jgi:hypothetical protein
MEEIAVAVPVYSRSSYALQVNLVGDGSPQVIVFSSDAIQVHFELSQAVELPAEPQSKVVGVSGTQIPLEVDIGRAYDSLTP